MAIKIDEGANNPMEALGITIDRCEELCTAIETIHAEHPKWHWGQILDYARQNVCRSDNEFAFMFYVFGRHSGRVDAMFSEFEGNLFNLIFGGGKRQSSYQFTSN